MKGARLGQAQIEAIQRALAGAGATEWEIYYEEGRELALEVQDGEVDSYEAAQTSGAAVRILQDGRIGFGYTADFSEAAIGYAVTTALAAAAACDPEPATTLARPDEVGPLAPLDLCDRELQDVPLRHKIDRARALEAAARHGAPEVARVRKASYGEGRGRVRLTNVHGLDLEDEGTVVHCDVLAVAEAQEDEQLGWEAEVGHFLRELDFERCGRTAARRAAALLGARPIPTGRYPVVLEPQVVCEILDVLSDGLLGESVYKKRSLFGGRLGEEVASPLVTLVDDGLHPGGVASSRFDGEGMPRGRTVLLDRGRLTRFLCDRTWGRKLGTASTGNSDRGGFRTTPSLAPSNLILSPGPAGAGDARALARGLGECLLIGELIGVHTADPISGDFSLGASGLLVRGGEPVQPVSGIAVAGNLLGLLRAVVAVGSELRFYGSAGAPAVALGGLDVAGE